MPKLKCNAQKCVFNCDTRCSKSVIKVIGAEAETPVDTACQSFIKKRYSENNNYQTEIGSFENVNPHVSVDCDSRDCRYNSRGVCISENIRIDGTQSMTPRDTRCQTFSR